MPARFVSGDVLGDKFRIVRILGEGGMGSVYEAEHLLLAERVAIKVLHTDGDDLATQSHRLLREARAAARIQNEHVARVSDFGTLSDGRPYLVMECVSGPSLSRVLAENGPLEPEVAVGHALEICLALAEAHALGIVHRDIKPSNILLAERRDGVRSVKVLDFGVAKMSSTNASTTVSSGTLGSPSYMSPEQIRDPREVDERSDIWAIGVVLFEMSTCRLPFEAFTASGVLAAITADDPTPPTRHRPDLDARLTAVILRCLERNRDLRFPRVVELASALVELAPNRAELAARVARLRETDHARPAAAEAVPLALAEETQLTQDATATSAVEPRPAPSRLRKSRIAFGVALGLGLLAALIGLGSRSNESTPSPAPVLAAPASAPAPAPAAPPVEHATPEPRRSVEAIASVKAPVVRSNRFRVQKAPATASVASPAPSHKSDYEYGPRK